MIRLDKHLCFALYAAARVLTRTYREFLDPIGLTYPQYLVLVVLWEEDGLTVSQIGRRLKLDSGTLTPLIKRMETMDLVLRERGTKDEREVHVRLRPKAESLRRDALVARKRVASRLGLSEREILRLRDDIMDLVAHL